VPLVFRVFYGFLDREGLREGEANTLTWNRLDLDRGVLTLDENKTDDARAWALDPGVTAPLIAWKKLHPRPEPTARLFLAENGGVLDGEHFATVFRERHLKAAVVDRAELYERSKNRMPIRVHDLRATFVTLSLANGRTESWVQDRTGHTSSMMINRYRRTARQAAELGLGTLAPLDQAIPELKELTPEPPAGGDGGGQKEPVSPPVSGVGDVRGGSSPLPSLQSLRALATTGTDESRQLSEPKSAASASFATRAVRSWTDRPVILPGVLAASSAMV